MLFSKPSAVITEITATPVPVAAIFPLRDTVAIFSFDEEYLIAAPFALPSAAFAMAFINADCFSSSLYESKSVVIAVVAFARSVFQQLLLLSFQLLSLYCCHMHLPVNMHGLLLFRHQ